MSKNIPTNKKLYARVKAEAKRKFDRWPSAYGSAWLVKEYKRRGGGYRKAEQGMEVNPFLKMMQDGGSTAKLEAALEAANQARYRSYGFVPDPVSNHERYGQYNLDPNRYQVVVQSYPMGHKSMPPGHIEMVLYDKLTGQVVNEHAGNKTRINRWDSGDGNLKVRLKDPEDGIRHAYLNLNQDQLDNFVRSAQGFRERVGNAIWGDNIPTGTPWGDALVKYATGKDQYNFISSNCADGVCTGLPYSERLREASASLGVTDPNALMDFLNSEAGRRLYNIDRIEGQNHYSSPVHDTYNTVIRNPINAFNTAVNTAEHFLENAGDVAYDGVSNAAANTASNFASSLFNYHFGGIVTPAEQMQMLSEEQAFINPFTESMMYGGEEYKKGGSIPTRYKNMGFTKVGVKKKSTRAGKKWMVLAKKGDKYKVVHGGDSNMQDFKQHGSEERKKRFWDRMGGKDSAKAKDPFSPLYWHKKFGTWAEGGETFNEDSQDFYRSGGENWIKEATDRMEQKGTVGAFTKQAKRAGYDSVQAFANKVLNNEDDFSKTTVKRAQFAKNMKDNATAKFGMQLPKFQGFNMSQVPTTSGMGSVYMQDQALEAELAQYAPPAPLSMINLPSKGIGTGLASPQLIPTETLIAKQQAQYANAEEAVEEKPESTAMINWVNIAGNAALGTLSGIGRGMEARRRQDEIAGMTSADNVFAMTPQGLPGDRGDYDVNTGFFRPDEMGFKNDARYWNPYVTQASTFRAKEGGQMGMVDEQLLQELIAAGADIEILD